jgi:TonB family protein
MTDLWVANVLAHAIQAALLTGGAALIHLTIRRAHPALRLALWQFVLALNVFAPLVQPWRPLHVLGIAPAGPAGWSSLTATTDPVARSADVPALVLALLAAGILLRLGWLALGAARLRTLVRASAPLAAVPDAVARAVRDVGVAAQFRLSDGVGPFSFGVRRPVVVCPRRFLLLDDGGQYLIAAHELHHVRRRDWLQAFVEEAAAALLWFQPWTWWVRAHIRLAREQLVDRSVARDEAARRTYVQMLLAMAGYPVPTLSSAASFIGVRELRERIEALYKEVPMSRVRITLTAGLTAMAVVSLAAIAAAAFPLHEGMSTPSLVSPVALVAQGAQPDEPVRIGGDVKPPRKIKDVRPVYPQEARDARIQGVVILDVVIDRAGLVSHVEVMRSVPELDQAALDAVQQWEFEPTSIKGKAVSVRMTVTVNFTLAEH